jgi:uncharacterized membrane protein YfcA
MTWGRAWRFVVVGAIGGLMSGLFGVGGGIVMVPLLIWVAKLDQRHASATSLLAITPTALVGAVNYGVRGELAVLPAVFVAVGAVGGSWLGARLLRVIKLKVLSWSFVALLAATAIFMVFFEPERASENRLTVWIGVGMVLLGVAMGLASGLFGIGGGVIAVPALMAVFGFGDLVARGTSLLVMVPSSITGTLTNIKGKLVDVKAGLVTGLTAMVAGWGGSSLAFLLDPRVGNLLFAALLVVSAIQLGLKAVKI